MFGSISFNPLVMITTKITHYNNQWKTTTCE